MDNQWITSLRGCITSEVHNGGFDQFFYQNSRLLPFAIEGLKKIGAGAHAVLLAKAAKIYEEYSALENPDHKANEAADDDDESLASNADTFDDTGRIHALDPLDTEYYALEDVYPLRVRFVRANIEKFFD